MNPGSCSHSLTVSVLSADCLEEALDQAVSQILEKALLERKRGILVTQEAPGQFTVALHDEVPFGMTKERQSWYA